MGKQTVTVALKASMCGFSFLYWMQGATLDSVEVTFSGGMSGVKTDLLNDMTNDPLTFGLCVVTSLLTMAAILLIEFSDRNKHFAKTAIVLIVIVIIVWITATAIYATRDAIDDKTIQITEHAYHFRKVDMIRGPVMLALSVLSLIMMFVSGLYK